MVQEAPLEADNRQEVAVSLELSHKTQTSEQVHLEGHLHNQVRHRDSEELHNLRSDSHRTPHQDSSEVAKDPKVLVDLDRASEEALEEQAVEA